jgi:hypothetical protein
MVCQLQLGAEPRDGGQDKFKEDTGPRRRRCREVWTRALYRALDLQGTDPLQLMAAQVADGARAGDPGAGAQDASASGGGVD